MRARRGAIQRHHTVTHLLHWALHEVVIARGDAEGLLRRAGQADVRLQQRRAHAAAGARRRAARERTHRRKRAVSWIEVPYAEVRGRADIMQFFGDKYGETVRVVQIGGEAARARWLLDGTLRRHAHARDGRDRPLPHQQREPPSPPACAASKRRPASTPTTSPPPTRNACTRSPRRLGTPLPELEKRIEGMLAQQKELEKALKAAQQREATRQAEELLRDFIDRTTGIPSIVRRVRAANQDELQSISDAIRSKGFEGVTVLAAPFESLVGITVNVSLGYTDRVQAGKIVQQIAPIIGGKGGGKPDTARGAGKDPSKLDEALAHARTLLG